MTSLDELAEEVRKALVMRGTPGTVEALDILLTRAKEAEAAYFDVRAELAKERDDHGATGDIAEQFRRERDKAQEQAIDAGRDRYQAERDRDTYREALGWLVIEADEPAQGDGARCPLCLGESHFEDCPIPLARQALRDVEVAGDGPEQDVGLKGPPGLQPEPASQTAPDRPAASTTYLKVPLEYDARIDGPDRQNRVCPTCGSDDPDYVRVRDDNATPPIAYRVLLASRDCPDTFHSDTEEAR
jgi:hypothetical protein